MCLDKHHPVAIHGKLIQVLTVVEVAEHYQDNIVYRDNLLIIELHQDITLSFITQLYSTYTHTVCLHEYKIYTM